MTSNRPTNASGGLEEKHVGALVPRIGICLEVVLTVINNNWSKLLHHAKQRRAAGASVKPNDDGVCKRLVH